MSWRIARGNSAAKSCGGRRCCRAAGVRRKLVRIVVSVWETVLGEVGGAIMFGGQRGGVSFDGGYVWMHVWMDDAPGLVGCGGWDAEGIGVGV